MATLEFLGRLSDQFETPLQLSLPAEVGKIEQLRVWLNAELNCDVFTQASIRAIVNQQIASESTSINNTDTITFFPPVGGG